MSRHLVIAALAMIMGLGCQPDEASAPSPEPIAQDQKPVATAPAAPKDHPPEGHACDRAPGPIANPEATTEVDPATGASKTIAGQKLSGAQVVKVADLVANPEAYAGKAIRLEGDVSAMCHHRRAWFALQDPGDRAGTHVRVLTTPQFLVPPGSIGKKARVEGTVEVIGVQPEAARHYAKDHKLGNPDDVKGPTKAVVLRAAGAEFL